MSRISQLVWPALALLASFAATLLLTWVFSEPGTPDEKPRDPVSVPAPTPTPVPTPTPEPTSYGLVLEAQGVRVPSTGDPAGTWTTDNLIELDGAQVCLAPALARDGWRPQDQVVWTQTTETWCRPLPPDGLVNVRFVK